ncbi:hypothetical protein ACIQGZ_20180 [Streptomyces sp. NPDC092296]|uniref:hypothetical protein n=1 Tax=Streptomyces sp. NPDC092296 TaxID=3366012 RepID=UPI003814365A
MTFVRWYAAEDDSGPEHAVEQAMSSDGWEDAVGISLGGGYRLMDCPVAGGDSPRPTPSGRTSRGPLPGPVVVHRAVLG